MKNKQKDVVGDLNKFVPDFMSYTSDLLLGEVWNRPGLSQRDRSLITVAALVTSHSVNQMPHHFERALANGITLDELKEIFLHLAFYAGWPAAFSAIGVAMNTIEPQENS